LVLENIKSVSEKIGFQIIDETLSPITGEKGNREFLLFLQKTEIKKR
jgi:predicted rRNA methylase YqxC with S4 and FtsJ domains